MSALRPIHILAISGSLRAQSKNSEVLLAAQRFAPNEFAVRLYQGLESLPHYNPDLDCEECVLPAPVQQLREALGAVDALIISSPEYAHGVPGSLKNALDWLVSGPEMVRKPTGLLTASAMSKHAPAALVETLNTMSANVVTSAVRVVPLGGRRMTADRILEDPTLADEIRGTLQALRAVVLPSA